MSRTRRPSIQTFSDYGAGEPEPFAHVVVQYLLGVANDEPAEDKMPSKEEMSYRLFACQIPFSRPGRIIKGGILVGSRP